MAEYSSAAPVFLPRTLAEAQFAVRAVLGELIDYDQNNELHLVETLQVYLGSDRNWTQSAKQLVIHPRLIAGPGLLVAGCGMWWLSTLKPDSAYLTHLMPGMIFSAVGLGLCFVPMTLGAVANVKDQDTGIAAALLNTSQQVGGALGLAVLTTIATTAANNQLPEAATSLYRGFATRDRSLIQAAGSALTHGYTTAFVVAAAFFLCGLVVTALAITAPAQKSTTAGTVHV